MEPVKTTDGLDRNRYRQQNPALPEFAPLESDPTALLGRWMEMSRGVRYFNDRDRPDGFMHELWENQYLSVLTEILLTRAEDLEKEFLNTAESSVQATLNASFRNRLQGWADRLDTYGRIRLAGDAKRAGDPVLEAADQLSEQLKNTLREVGDYLTRQKKNIAETGVSERREQIDRHRDIAHNRVFYLLFTTLRKIRSEQAYYLGVLEKSGRLDPSLAVAAVFHKNYGAIAAAFNRKWETLPSFYVAGILRSRPQGARPDRVWLQPVKSPGEKPLTLPANTGFVALENPDGSRLCYDTTDEAYVSDLAPAHILSVFTERNRLLQPAGRLYDRVTGQSYVTAVKQKEFSIVPGKPQDWFGEKTGPAQQVPVGLMIESPLLLLREGKREGRLYMHLTPASADTLQRLIADACLDGEGTEDIQYKLFQDAFYLKISTTEGWKELPGTLAYRSPENTLVVSFHINERFPSTAACTEALHAMVTADPALQLILNRDAWLYPFSWASETYIDRFLLQVHVEGISAVSVYGENGPVDTSAPFYPFGVEAPKNSWMVFGNYEMSLKHLTQVEAECRWQQLPADPAGFKGHYSHYDRPVDNYSFHVRIETLDNRKWVSCGPSCYLFDADRADSPVADVTTFRFEPPWDRMPAVGKEDDFGFAGARNGFFRFVLDSPDMGFGHALYRQLFARVMMQNSRSKKERPLPAEPVSPMIETIRLGYRAEGEYIASAASLQALRLYHTKPLIRTEAFPVATGAPVPLVSLDDSDAALKLGFENALGCERVRFYLDMAPGSEYCEPEQGTDELPQIAWYLFDGCDWTELPAGSWLKDSTEKFTAPGLVELSLPVPVSAPMLDKNGLFWIKADVIRYAGRCLFFRGLYLHAVEAVARGGDGNPLPPATVSEPEYTQPGIIAVTQLFEGSGGCPEESDGDLHIRTAHRIAHRNRAIAPVDFERIVLAAFPQVEKVKCLPASDASATVTLVVMQRQPEGTFPLCPYRLRQAVAAYLAERVSPFVKIKVINPLYEEITVRCYVRLHAHALEAETVSRLRRKFDTYIAPWKKTPAMPSLGYVPSLEALFTILANDRGVERVFYLSVLLVNPEKDAPSDFVLTEYRDDRKECPEVRLSRPWSVPVPSGNHLIRCSATEVDPDVGPVGIGELIINNTLIIK